MKRLTGKDEKGYKLTLKSATESTHEEFWSVSTSSNATQTIRGHAIDKFAKYEDMEEHGKLFKSLFRIGDTVYILSRSQIIEAQVIKIELFSLEQNIIMQYLCRNDAELWNLHFTDAEIGDFVFPTWGEAEAALGTNKKED